MTRISTLNAFAESVRNLQRRQEEMSDAQSRLTSGLRVLKPSDDPTAAARAERARALSQRSDSSQRAVDASRTAMSLTESALGDAGDLLQDARDIVVNAGNASYTDAERSDLADQLDGIRKQLLGVANRTDGQGGYVFSGQGSSAAPFLDTTSGVAYLGSGGSVQVASSEPMPLTLDGNAVWLSGTSGNGVFDTGTSNSTSAWVDTGRVTSPADLTGASYSVQFSVAADGTTTYDVLKDGQPTATVGAPFVSGEAIEFDGMAITITGTPKQGDSFEATPATHDLSVFDALDNIINALREPGRTDSQITQTVQSGIGQIDALRNHVQSARSQAGEMLNRIDGIEGRVQDLKLFAETTRSNSEDLDMVQAITDFENKNTGYQAALQTYSSMQRMSMFDYING